MALTRRNALLGLVVLVVGAGMIGASGAFSSVQADRTMTVETSGDDAALLKLDSLDSTIAGTESNSDTGGVEILKISNKNVNENAITRFDDAFRITNNGNDNIDSLYVELPDGVSNGAVDIRVDSKDSTGEYTSEDSIVGQSNSMSLGAAGGSVTVGIVIDTTGANTQDDLPQDGTLTIIAEDTNDATDNDANETPSS